MSNPARAAAQAYCAVINDKDLDRLLGLFAEDGVLLHPIGTFEGREKLGEFYGGIVMKADTKLTMGLCAAEGDLAIAEVTGVSPPRHPTSPSTPATSSA